MCNAHLSDQGKLMIWYSAFVGLSLKMNEEVLQINKREDPTDPGKQRVEGTGSPAEELGSIDYLQRQD